MKHGLGDAYLIVLYIEEEREEYLLSNSSMRDACVSCRWEPSQSLKLRPNPCYVQVVELHTEYI